MDDPGVRKEAVLAAIRTAAKAAEGSYRRSLRLGEVYHQVYRIAGLAERIVVGLPATAFTGRSWIEYAQRWTLTAEVAATGTDDQERYAVVRAAGDTMASGLMSITSMDVLPWLESGKPALVGTIHDVVLQYRDLQNAYDTVVGRLAGARLLNSRSGKRSPLDLMQEARAALDVPSTGRVSGAGVLLPFRGAIDEVFEQITRRLPEQVSAKGWPAKTANILRQCGIAGLPQEFIADLARDADRLNDNMSDAKTSELSVDDVQDIYHRGLLFLSALLSSLDQTKLQPGGPV